MRLFDHTADNEKLGKAGALIMAHENVRKRMTAGQFMKAIKKKIPAALPVITFAQNMTFHWNGDTVHGLHVGPGHTDGDCIIDFKKTNVIHAGDSFFNGFYPFIDEGSGASLKGLIGACINGLRDPQR